MKCFLTPRIVCSFLRHATMTFWHGSPGGLRETLNSHICKKVDKHEMRIIVQHVIDFPLTGTLIITKNKARRSPLKMGPTGCPETAVTNYQSMQRNISEDLRQEMETQNIMNFIVQRISSIQTASKHINVNLRLLVSFQSTRWFKYDRD